MNYYGAPNQFKLKFKDILPGDQKDIYLRTYIDEDEQHWNKFRKDIVQSTPLEKENEDRLLKLHWAHSASQRTSTFTPTYPQGREESMLQRALRGNMTYANSSHHFAPSFIDNKRVVPLAAKLPIVSGHIPDGTQPFREENEGPASEYSSGRKLRDDLVKHKRLKYSPQEKFVRPLTSSSAIGWHHKERLKESRKVYYPKKSCYASSMIKNNH